ncbi:MAG: hypothetical protein NC453_11870 [Muribaculum sp.]|nr:hypothetical protein [Muribaculum sp.]
MSTPTTYTVLWIDDDTSIVESTKMIADEYNLILEHYTNWQQAESSLRKNFTEYSAIILDANCKLRPLEPEKEEFITAVLPQLLQIFGEKQTAIPWYILSAGTMSNFSTTVNGAAASRERYSEEWGEMMYLKDVPEDNSRNARFLFDRISTIAKDQGTNIVLCRHKDVFNYIGDNSVVDKRARKIMLKMLSTLYYPEENIKYEYAGNPLRKVMEYLFRSARKWGLLTTDIFDKDDHFVLLDANRYLSGLNIYCYNGRELKHKARWGNPGTGKDGKGGDCVFPSEIGEIGRAILNFSNSDSHTEEEDVPYLIEENKKEVFFGYVLLLCHVIKFFGQYVEAHNDIKANMANQRIMPLEEMPKKTSGRKNSSPKREVPKIELPNKEDILKNVYLIQRDCNGNFYCGRCKLSSDIALKSGMVKIVELIDNTGDDADTYPYIAVKVTQS